MGLSAFFTYTVVFGMGYSSQTALAAVFLEGLLFIALSFFNVRYRQVQGYRRNLDSLHCFPGAVLYKVVYLRHGEAAAFCAAA
jgi:hypothetical protein